MTVQNCNRRPARGGAATTHVFAILGLTLLTGAAFAEEVHVKIDNFVFSPEAITVKPGDTVTWENDDDIPHTVVASRRAFFRSKPMDTGDKYSFTFKDAGSFEYFCGLHPHMKGKIIVAP